jgi:hypothetical protein
VGITREVAVRRFCAIADLVAGVAACTPQQFAVAWRVGAVIASSPRYRFDGARLQLISEKTTITLALVSKAEMVNGGFG